MMKQVDVEEPTPPLNLEKLERTQRAMRAESEDRARKQKPCSNLLSHQELSNTYLVVRDPTQTPSPDLTMWKNMQENQAIIQSLHTLFVWSPIQRWRIEESWTIFISLSQVVQNASVTRASADPTLFMIGRSPDTSCHQVEKKKVVTNAWLDWFLAFISQLSTDNIVLLATPFSIVDKIFSKTPILEGGLKDSKFNVRWQVSHIRFGKLDMCKQ